MPLTVGEKLGVYEILSPLGAGGMGEVYRARDSKLGREVAIKVLPEEFTQHPQKLARFEREARLLASLNHPGIATLHGLEEAEGKPFLVMELVEGETLAEQISRGPVPVTEALTLSQQIAEALEAAHEKGVIHRDLKPANIKVDPEGHVKVLDFGLAKAFADEVPESELSQSPTLSRDATRAGVILGTAAYMSPEQAKGKTVDKRTDIFSFGIVLYEMLTGKRAFGGEDVSDVLAAILRMEPDWKAVPPDLDPRTQNLLRRCLRKDRKNRRQSIGDVRVEIEDIIAEPTAASTQQPLALSTPSRARGRAAWGLAVLLAALVTGLTVWSVTRPEPPAPQTITRFPVTLPPGDAFTNTGRHVVALSPDGTRLVYVANQQLYLREMDQLEAAPIRGTDLIPTSPFFSPDGQWVGFYAQGNLRKVSVTGGAPVTLCEANNPWGASWGADDIIVFGQGSRGILRVAANGGTPEVLIPMDSEKAEMGHGPQMLPDGETVLFTLRTEGTWDDAQIVTQSLETGERRVLIERGSDARYVPTGHLVYAVGNTLLAVPFDLARLEVTGGPVPVVEGVGRAFNQSTGAAHASFSDSGSLVYVAGFAGLAKRSFVWVDREGREEPVAAEPQNYNEFTLSPDGTQLAVRLFTENSDVWIYDLVRDTQTRLTFDPATEFSPLWTPDGQRVAFGSAEGMSWKAADGTGEVEPLVENPINHAPLAFSPDGTVLVFEDRRLGRDLAMLSLEGERTSTLLLNTEFTERNAALSPDGRWMAYESDESGQFEIYVRPFPDVNDGKWQVSNGGGVWPFWAPDGRELFYLASGQLDMMAVAIETEPTFTLGTREPLFDTEPYYTRRTLRRGAIAPDGQRFLLLKEGVESEGTAAPPLVVVQNWFEELKRLVPTN